MLLECAVAALSVATTLNYAPANDKVYSNSASDVVPWLLIVALLARSGPISLTTKIDGLAANYVMSSICNTAAGAMGGHQSRYKTMQRRQQVCL